MEIERKFLIPKMSEKLWSLKSIPVYQAYLSAANDSEVRIRKMGRKHTITVKSSGSLERHEVETEISSKQFKILWPSAGSRTIIKERMSCKWNNHIIEIDVFKGKLSGLFIAEVEFESIEMAREFSPPDYFGDEITYDYRYKNKNLSMVESEYIEELFAVQHETEYQLIGALPYLKGSRGLRTVLITTKNHYQWIFPKGQNIENIPNRNVAEIEALEEAGIKGTVSGPPILIPYQKSTGRYTMQLFPMKIEKVLKNWEESDQRDRCIVDLNEAYSLVTQPGLIAGLDYLKHFEF